MRAVKLCKMLQKSLHFSTTDTSLSGRKLDFLHLVFICDIASDISCRNLQSNLGRAASPTLTSENNYATMFPLVTKGCPTFTPEIALSPSTISTPCNTPIHRPTPHRPKHHPDPLSRFATVHPPDRPTDGIGDKFLATRANALLIV